MDESNTEQKVQELTDSDTESFKSCDADIAEPQIQDATDEAKVENVGNEVVTDEQDAEEHKEEHKGELPKVEPHIGDIEKANECKTKGNELFKCEEYTEALDYYNQAISY